MVPWYMHADHEWCIAHYTQPFYNMLNYFCIDSKEDYVITPLKAIMNSGKIANNVTSAAGCADGPTCM